MTCPGYGGPDEGFSDVMLHREKEREREKKNETKKEERRKKTERWRDRRDD